MGALYGIAQSAGSIGEGLTRARAEQRQRHLDALNEALSKAQTEAGLQESAMKMKQGEQNLQKGELELKSMKDQYAGRQQKSIALKNLSARPQFSPEIKAGLDFIAQAYADSDPDTGIQMASWFVEKAASTSAQEALEQIKNKWRQQMLEQKEIKPFPTTGMAKGLTVPGLGTLTPDMDLWKDNEERYNLNYLLKARNDSVKEQQDQLLKRQMTVAGVPRQTVSTEFQNPDTGLTTKESVSAKSAKPPALTIPENARPAPTNADKNRASLAKNAMENLNSLEEIATKRPDLFGQVNGYLTRKKIEHPSLSSDPDIAALRELKDLIGKPLQGAHGMRSVIGVQRTEEALFNSFSQGPEGFKKAAEAVRASLQQFIDEASGKGAASSGGASTTHKIGEKKTFPNGRVGVWDGTGWVAQ